VSLNNCVCEFSHYKGSPVAILLPDSPSPKRQIYLVSE